MAGSFVSQLAISRAEVYSMYLTEKNPEAKKCLEKYYIMSGGLLEKFLEEHGRIEIEPVVPINSRSNVEYFRKLLLALRAEYPQESRRVVDLVRAEILGLIASTRQNLENLLV